VSLSSKPVEIPCKSASALQHDIPRSCKNPGAIGTSASLVGSPKFPGQWVAYAHTFFLYSMLCPLYRDLTVAAFIAAFVIGVSLHYKQLVETDYSVYPSEWFPSVSATTGFPRANPILMSRRLLSGTECLPYIHRSYFASPLHPHLPLVRPHQTPRKGEIESNSLPRTRPHPLFRYLRLRFFERGFQCPRAVWSGVFGSYSSVDSGDYFDGSAEPAGEEVQEDYCGMSLFYVAANDYLLHSTHEEYSWK
jgi:hypothetical protein